MKNIPNHIEAKFPSLIFFDLGKDPGIDVAQSTYYSNHKALNFNHEKLLWSLNRHILLQNQHQNTELPTIAVGTGSRDNVLELTKSTL